MIDQELDKIQRISEALGTGVSAGRRQIPKSKFNEDDGPINEEDEVYAVASFRDGDGRERIQFSQKVVRYF